MTDVPTLAAVHYEARYPIDEFMRSTAEALAGGGLRIAGVIQENGRNPREDGSCCATMTLIDLRTGERFKISQDLGTDARGCRLDPRGLADVEGRLDAAIATGVDLLVLNKFGRAESEGRGLREVLAHALGAGVPVLTAVRPPYDEAWQAFHGGLAASLTPQPAAVLAWLRALTGQPLEFHAQALLT